MRSIKYKILLALFLISFLSSLMLSLASSTDIAFCDITGEGGCNTVAASPQNYTFGIKNSHFGVLIFLALSVLTYLQIKKPTEERKKTINISVLLGSAVALYFLYVQKFVLQSYCTYCLIVNFSMILALVIVLTKWRE